MDTKEAESIKIQEHLQQFIVGVSDYDLPFSTSHEAKLICTHMAEQASHSIKIVSRDLDNQIYNNRPFCNAIVKLIKANPKASVKILIHDASKANTKNHLLVNTYQRLSSFISIKRFNDEFKNYNHAYLNIDSKAILFRDYADLYNGNANYNTSTCKTLDIEFDKMWDMSETEQEFNTLNI